MNSTGRLEANKADGVTPKQVDDRLKDFKDIFATKETWREIGNTKAELIKWMFIFSISQMAATLLFEILWSLKPA